MSLETTAMRHACDWNDFCVLEKLPCFGVVIHSTFGA